MSMSVSRRAGAAAGVVAVLVGALASCGGGAKAPPRPNVRLAAPAYVADPVPEDERRTKGDLPGHCGVDTATLRTYVPGADDTDFHRGQCYWRSVKDEPSGGDHERVLRVGFDDPLTSGDDDASADGDALRALDPAVEPDLMATGNAPRPVSGIGDEALYAYAGGADGGIGRDVGAELRFRAGATLVRVVYSGNDLPGHFGDPERQVPENEARRAVLAAAADVAKGLHVPAKPAVPRATATAVPPPAPRTVRPCDLLPAALAGTLAPGAIRRGQKDATGTAEYGRAATACAWDVKADHRPERHLLVSVHAESQWRPGIAVAQARRHYLEWHDDARSAHAADFHAVRNLGDQAYAVYVRGEKAGDDNGGEVVFRYRDRVVLVSYSGGDPGQIRESGDRPLEEKTAVNGAYTAATRILEALR